jgi:hypothetical protein
MNMHLDPGRYAVRFDIQSRLEFSRGHIVWDRKPRRARSLGLELLAKSEIHRLPKYRMDISKDSVLEIRVRLESLMQIRSANAAGEPGKPVKV